MQIRSLLYTPGNDRRKVDKVGSFGADGVILDLEDAVPIDEKVAAREIVRGAIPAVKGLAGRVYVRVNPTGEKTDFSVATGAEDIEAVLCPELDGLVVPKVESAEELGRLDPLIAAIERKQGRPEGAVEVASIIETALGLWNAFEIARSSSRIRALHFGAGDFTRDLNLDWTRDEAELMYARSRLVVISRAAGIGAPIDSVWARLDDGEGFAESARQAKRMGFQGKCCIHPAQVSVANHEFSYVSPDELAEARKVVDAFEEAQRRGSASIRVGGQFVDYPIVEKSRRIVELHDMSEQQPEGRG